MVDDGQGFDVSSVQSNGGGLGLVTMEERVDLIGGDISVVSEAGRGTTVRVRGRANPKPRSLTTTSSRSALDKCHARASG